MPDNQLNVLLVKFDSRSREQSLVDCFNEQKVSYKIFTARCVGWFVFLRRIKREIEIQGSNVVVFVGYNHLVIIWVVVNWFTSRITYAVRLGGDPVGVPWTRFTNARKYLPENKRGLLGGLVRHIVNVAGIILIRNVILVTQHLAQQSRFSDKEVFVLPPAPKLLESVDARQGLRKLGEANLLCVTNLNYFEKYQGVIDIINTLRLVDFDKSISLKIVGGGDYLPKLNEFLGTLKVDFSIKLCGYQTNLEPYYTNADIFIYSSTLDAWPNVLMDAMVYGLPIISNYHPSFSEIFDESQRPFLYDSGRFGELQNDLEKMLNDETFFSSRSRQSLDREVEVRNVLISSDGLVDWLHKIAAT